MKKRYIRDWLCRLVGITEEKEETLTLESFMDEVHAWLDHHRAKINVNNRFCISVRILEDVFPEYPSEIIRKGWKEMIQLGYVTQDPVDREWIIK